MTRFKVQIEMSASDEVTLRYSIRLEDNITVGCVLLRQTRLGWLLVFMLVFMLVLSYFFLLGYNCFWLV